MKSSPIFSIRNLRFAYKSRNVIEIDALDLEAGRITVFAGGNGSGKTTLLKLLNGLLQPGAGVILYRNRPINNDDYSLVRSESVLVHQNPYLFGGTVYQNVAYGLKIRKTPGRIMRRKVAEKLALLGLEGFEHRRSGELSIGEKQRVAMARALVLEPGLLLLDEPTANVDPGSIGLIEALILKLAQLGITVILSTHNPGFAYRLCDRLIGLEEGKVVPNEVNIFKGRVAEEDGKFTYFQTGTRALRCPAQAGEFTTAVLPLDDVILSKARIQTSAQNRFKGPVKEINRVNHMYRVGLDCGFRVEAYITGYSLESLEVGLGKEFHVTFKASAIRLY